MYRTKESKAKTFTYKINAGDEIFLIIQSFMFAMNRDLVKKTDRY